LRSMIVVMCIFIGNNDVGKRGKAVHHHSHSYHHSQSPHTTDVFVVVGVVASTRSTRVELGIA